MVTNKIKPEIFILDEPIKIFCVNADSFPEGVMKAHQTLHGIASFNPGRRFFGISWGKQSITYKAGATELHPGELNKKGLEEFTVRKGKYLAVMLNDFNQIKDVFARLIEDTRIDPNGYCVEMYLDMDKVRCMVTLK